MKIVCCALMLAAFLPAASTQLIGQASGSAMARTATPAQSIVDAMAYAGIFVQPSQIELLSGTVNLRQGANLQIVKMTEATPGSIRVKLRCQDHRECLPFYVLVHGVAGVITHNAQPASPDVLSRPLPNVVRGGDHAILILETSDSRLSFPVICLQNGAPGQKVRVTSPDHARFYEAEVVAAGLLKGNL